MIFVNYDFGPFSKSIDFCFGLLLDFDQLFNVLLELGLFINKFESFVFVVIDFFDHVLGVVVNVLIVLSFGNDLIF